MQRLSPFYLLMMATTKTYFTRQCDKKKNDIIKLHNGGSNKRVGRYSEMEVVAKRRLGTINSSGYKTQRNAT